MIRPVGLLAMQDEMGGDEKILAVPIADPRFEGVKDIQDLPKHLLLEIENFFGTYKVLEGKDSQVKGWLGFEHALAVLHKSFETHNRGYRPS